MDIKLRVLQETQPLVWLDKNKDVIKVRCLFCPNDTTVQLAIMRELGETSRIDSCQFCTEDFIIEVAESIVELFVAFAYCRRDVIALNKRWRKYGFAVRRNKIIEV